MKQILLKQSPIRLEQQDYQKLRERYSGETAGAVSCAVP
jgi:hypothetical protein